MSWRASGILSALTLTLLTSGCHGCDRRQADAASEARGARPPAEPEGTTLSASPSDAGTPPNGAASYSTNFDATESPISEKGAWTQRGLDWARIDTANGVAYGTQKGTGSFDDSYAHLSGFPPNQSASGVVHLDPAINHGTTHEVEILLRWADTSHSARGYECNFAYDGGYVQIVRWNGKVGDFTYLAGESAPGGGKVPGGMHDGDRVRAQIVGSVITVYVNDVRVATATDSTWATGDPGMAFWRGGANGLLLSDYGFTSFTASSLAP